jgi:hypothetical protein
LRRRVIRISRRQSQQPSLGPAHDEYKTEIGAALCRPAVVFKTAERRAERAAKIDAAAEALAVDDSPLQVPDRDVVIYIRNGKRIVAGAAHRPIVEFIAGVRPFSSAECVLLYEARGSAQALV